MSFEDYLAFIQTPEHRSLNFEEQQKAKRKYIEEQQKAENEAYKERKRQREEEKINYLEECKCCRPKERRSALKWSLILGILCALFAGFVWSAPTGLLFGLLFGWYCYIKIRDSQKEERKQRFISRFGYHPPLE